MLRGCKQPVRVLENYEKSSLFPTNYAIIHIKPAKHKMSVEDHKQPTST